MAHQSLYRSYRPQTFDDVVGQEHIERTLRNAISDNTFSHAYLFTGPRGTGKTTTARILAKALNCEHGPTPDPDGTCESCIEIAEGRHPDVYEIDAASRTGVENVREEIIGRVLFAPTRGRYKVYIIDEVHMLSAAAFNALLKTLEEPPPHVVFVLATTHPHKLPETIQSRCQRFDFRRLSIDDIVGRLRVICDGEGFEVPGAALSLIARHARGGMRDAITTLEQLASFTGGSVALDDVEGLLGEVDSAKLFEISALVARRDIAGCFRWIARFVEEGTDLAEFVREITGHVRNLYLIAAVGDGRGIVEVSAEELAQLEAQAAEFGGPDRLARVLDLLGELGSEMRWSSDQRLSLEVALTRMARPAGEMTLEALAERVEALEDASSGSVPAPVAQVSRPGKSAEPDREAHAVPPKARPAPASPDVKQASADAEAPQLSGEAAAPASAPLDTAAAKRAWPAVLVELRKLKAPRAQMYAQVEVDVDTDGKTIVLEFPSDQSFAMEMAEEPEMREVLRRALVAVLGSAPPARFQLGRGAVRPQAESAGPQETTAPPVASERAEGSADSATSPSDEPIGRVAEPIAPRDSVAGADAGDGTANNLERLLVDALGAEIVDDLPADSAASGGIAPTSAGDAREAAGFGQLDPDAFETTD